VTGALGAIEAASGSGYKLGIPCIEGGHLENEHQLVLNPLLKLANRKQDAPGLLATRHPFLAEAF
jgi:hypothetical protein